MDLLTARDILGISDGAGEDEVQRAFRDSYNELQVQVSNAITPENRTIAQRRLREVEEARRVVVEWLHGLPRGQPDVPPRTVVVPDVLGLEVAAASQTLATIGLDIRVREDRVPAQSVRAGRVARQRPAGGVPSNPGNVVDVWLALAVPPPPEPPTMASIPSVVGRTVQTATDVLARAGLQARVRGRARSEDIPAGRVLRQSPASGTTAPQGQVVGLWESVGSPRVGWPDRIVAFVFLTLGFWNFIVSPDQARLARTQTDQVRSALMRTGIAANARPFVPWELDSLRMASTAANGRLEVRFSRLDEPGQPPARRYASCEVAYSYPGSSPLTPPRLAGLRMQNWASTPHDPCWSEAFPAVPGSRVSVETVACADAFDFANVARDASQPQVWLGRHDSLAVGLGLLPDGSPQILQRLNGQISVLSSTAALTNPQKVFGSCATLQLEVRDTHVKGTVTDSLVIRLVEARLPQAVAGYPYLAVSEGRAWVFRHLLAERLP